MSLTIDNREALFADVRRGDGVAFDTLYRGMFQPLLAAVQAILLDHAQSEEVAQEVLVEVWQTAARFDSSRSGLATWMKMIARRRAIDRVRAAESSRLRDVRIGIRDFTEVADDPAQVVEVRLDFERVLGALDTLPEAQRRAIELCFLQQLSRTEVARCLGIPLSTANWHIRRGLAALRVLLQEHNATTVWV
ncbi:sigma-70 family RNA polymerase sigma factor [Subtercola endophyticus]|uniref:sigma-70 family RNA polymerase sigma factor n=1 Tax=Subtercola endophyticus TaxID=2895559 RepID=UPI001E4D3986|nr:sigma-70 family RNA polymerase sigma factor [Subtercola endophyticus]UFS59582.1 sigma-70 family RNA polymerase sigma factor [Subtercola endophyticus]